MKTRHIGIVLTTIGCVCWSGAQAQQSFNGLPQVDIHNAFDGGPTGPIKPGTDVVPVFQYPTGSTYGLTLGSFASQ